MEGHGMFNNSDQDKHFTECKKKYFSERKKLFCIVGRCTQKRRL
jgi:hypothetical protein